MGVRNSLYSVDQMNHTILEIIDLRNSKGLEEELKQRFMKVDQSS